MNFQNAVNEKELIEKKTVKENQITEVFDQKPTPAFVGASWFTLGAGILSFCIGLWYADMELNEKGYYFTVLLFGLFAVISVQKAVRDKLENIPVSTIYNSVSWFATGVSLLLLIVGLWNADMLLSEKGFYGMSFTLSLFSAIAVQKNTRDVQYIDREKEHSIIER